MGEGGQAGGVWRWVRMVSERARAVVGETAKWARAGEHACVRAVVGEGGGGDGEVGKGRRAGEHALVRRWVRVVGEMARRADTRARACTREGG